MPALTPKDVEEIAFLARLELKPPEILRMTEELGAILGHIDQLSALDTEGVEPKTHAVPMDLPLRPDVATGSLPRELALAAAPRPAEGFFEVPRIIGGKASPTAPTDDDA